MSGEEKNIRKTNLARKKQVRIWIFNHKAVILLPRTPFEQENQTINWSVNCKAQNNKSMADNINLKQFFKYIFNRAEKAYTAADIPQAVQRINVQ